jgi:hypothetical protein
MTTSGNNLSEPQANDPDVRNGCRLVLDREGYGRVVSSTGPAAIAERLSRT